MPPVDAHTWQALSSQWVEAVGPFDELAVHERIQVSRRGFAAVLLSEGRPVGFVKVRNGDDAPLRNEHRALTLMDATSPASFDVPRPLGLASVGGWSFLLTSVLRPELHRVPTDPPIDEVAAEIQAGLASLPRPPETPEHWTPMHGDFTPWNLRQRRDGSLFLIDWEDAEWAPPRADVVYYQAVSTALRGPTKAPVTDEEARAFWWHRLSERDIGSRGQDIDAELRKATMSALTVSDQ
jgi:aminoglycoside phosphotransferase (APT) family kinase protein